MLEDETADNSFACSKSRSCLILVVTFFLQSVLESRDLEMRGSLSTFDHADQDGGRAVMVVPTSRQFLPRYESPPNTDRAEYISQCSLEKSSKRLSLIVFVNQYAPRSAR